MTTKHDKRGPLVTGGHGDGQELDPGYYVLFHGTNVLTDLPVGWVLITDEVPGTEHWALFVGLYLKPNENGVRMPLYFQRQESAMSLDDFKKAMHKRKFEDEKPTTYHVHVVTNETIT